MASSYDISPFFGGQAIYGACLIYSILGTYITLSLLCFSVCETASVASDLTRMYVSDEDEKPEIFIRPVISVDNIVNGRDHDYGHDHDGRDIDSATVEKRPRVQFSPTL